MITFFVGLIVGGCVAALAFVLCETSDDRTKDCPIGDKCCYFCSGSSECKHACKTSPSECGRNIKL